MLYEGSRSFTCGAHRLPGPGRALVRVRYPHGVHGYHRSKWIVYNPGTDNVLFVWQC